MSFVFKECRGLGFVLMSESGRRAWDERSKLILP